MIVVDPSKRWSCKGIVPGGPTPFQVTVPLENPEMSDPTRIILLFRLHPSMPIFLAALLDALRSIFRSRAELQLENLALHHQSECSIARRENARN